MDFPRIFLTAFAIPFIAAALWQGGSCQGRKGSSNMSGDIDQTARLNGVWGGDNIVMEISDKGATIEYECGSGTIDGAIALDKNGSFKTSGMHTKERGGPRRGESTPANYSGRTDGKTMTLIVTLTKTNENVGTFTLERGRRPQLTKCM